MLALVFCIPTKANVRRSRLTAPCLSALVSCLSCGMGFIPFRVRRPRPAPARGESPPTRRGFELPRSCAAEPRPHTRRRKKDAGRRSLGAFEVGQLVCFAEQAFCRCARCHQGARVDGERQPFASGGVWALLKRPRDPPCVHERAHARVDQQGLRRPQKKNCKKKLKENTK